MKELVAWLIHTPAGTVAFLSAIAAFIYPEGSHAHRRSGRIIIVSILIMVVSGSIAGYLKGALTMFFGISCFLLSIYGLGDIIS